MTIATAAPSHRDSVPSWTRPLRDLNGNGAPRISLLLRAVGLSDLQGLTGHSDEPNFAGVADEALQPVPARVPIHRFASDPPVGAAYAEGQRWTRDPIGSRVQSNSPRIPHNKVTAWLRPIKIPCQGPITG